MTTYAIFDLLYLEGRDLMAEPYARRRELLPASREGGLPGLVLKRLDSSYEPGAVADSWRSVS